jgi:hypothetical protein
MTLLSPIRIHRCSSGAISPLASGERAGRGGKLSLDESRQFLRFYESGLEGYTYLEEP